MDEETDPNWFREVKVELENVVFYLLYHFLSLSSLFAFVRVVS